jgi:predicted helicase
MDNILKILEKHNLQKETDSLNQFYASVKMRAEGIENASGKQKIILELYDKFFRNAFPKLTERLGIVYTPVECVDFIIHSVNDLLKEEFGQTLGSDQVHIIDPFTGTGTFITRLLQSGLLTRQELIQKYKSQIHANEIVLLAYYIAAINIEAVYHELIEEEYTPFTGICLTDTFQLYEKDDLIQRMLVDNSNRRSKQKKLDIKVIICNPPYSSGQESANDNNQNVKYPYLDSRIEHSYVANTSAVLRNSLYNSYIRAIRWASDRIGESGIIGMITNAGFLEGNAMDGLRKCLSKEFDDIYIVHLRGNAYTSGEQRKKEKDNVFGQGSRTPVAICFFIKNKKSNESSNIYFYDIGDYLNKSEKLNKLKDLYSLNNLKSNSQFKNLIPDKYYDWINQRNSETEDLILLGGKTFAK